MLEFHGITKTQDKLIRYKETFAFRESLHATLYIYNALKAEKEACFSAIKKEIDTLYASSSVQKQELASFRALVSKWLRVKDTMLFLFEEPTITSFKLEIFTILQKKVSITTKWNAIAAILDSWLDAFSEASFYSLLANESSQLHKIVNFILLIFLDQDESLPPPNLRLRFKKDAFPQAVWICNQKVSAYVEPFWNTKNQLCHKSVLIAAIQKKREEKKYAYLATMNVSILPSRYNHKTPTSLFLQSNKKDNEQLTLIQHTTADGLVNLQKTIQDQFSYEGVHHFLAFIRQVSSLSQQQVISFSLKSHLQLLYNSTLTATKEKKATTLLSNLLTLLQSTKVVRLDEENRRLETPFITCCGEETTNKTKNYRLILDPMFTKKNNKYALGDHIRLIPTALFNETPRLHPFITPLASYFTGSWLYKLAPITTSREDLLERAALFQGKRTKQELIKKIDSELTYMEVKKYIGKLKIDSHKMSYYIAPPSFLLPNKQSA